MQTRTFRIPASAPRDFVGAARLCCFHPLSPPRRFALLSFSPGFLPCFLPFCLSFLSILFPFLFSMLFSFFLSVFPFFLFCLIIISFFPFLGSFPLCFLFSFVFFPFFFKKKQDVFCLDSVTGHSPIVIIVVQSLSRVRLFLFPAGCSPPGSSVHGILQARRLSSCRGSPAPRGRTRVSRAAGRFFTA